MTRAMNDAKITLANATVATTQERKVRAKRLDRLFHIVRFGGWEEISGAAKDLDEHARRERYFGCEFRGL